MTPDHRRWLLTEHVIGAGVFNFGLNALIAWLMTRRMEVVPLWGEMSIGGDTIGTAFMLPLLTTVMVSRVVARWHAAGRVEVLGWTRAEHPALAALPAGRGARGAMLGALAALVVGVPLSLMLGVVGVASMSVGGFVLFKASFAAVLAAVVQPVVVLAALADAGVPTRDSGA